MQSFTPPEKLGETKSVLNLQKHTKPVSCINWFNSLRTMFWFLVQVLLTFFQQLFAPCGNSVINTICTDSKLKHWSLPLSSQNFHTISEQAVHCFTSMKLNSTHFISPPMATLGKSSVKRSDCWRWQTDFGGNHLLHCFQKLLCKKQEMTMFCFWLFCRSWWMMVLLLS